MTDVRFWPMAAVGAWFFLLHFWRHRLRLPPSRPLRVHRFVAAMAGSRTSYVDCKGLAWQVASVSLPIWTRLNVSPGFELSLIGLGTGVFAYFLFNYIAKRRLKSAEFVLIKGRFAFLEVGDYTAESKTVCRHCGYQEPVWNLRDMRLEAELRKPSVGFAYSDRKDVTVLVPSEIAAALRDAMVSGCVLQPLGGGEPAK